MEANLNALGSGLTAASVIAGAAAVVAFWRQGVGLLHQVGNYLVGTAFLESDTASLLFAYLASKRRMPTTRPRTFHTGKLYVKPRRRRERVVYESLRDASSLLFIGLAPVLVAKWKNNSNGGGHTPTSLRWIRGTINIDRLLREAAEFVNEREHSSATNRRFRVIRKTGAGSFGRRLGSTMRANDPSQPAPAMYSGGAEECFEGVRQGALVPVSCAAHDIDVDGMGTREPFKLYSYPAAILDAVEEVRTWHRSGDWYKDRGIPWTRGWLLHGVPGTGKTMLLRSLAQDLDMPIYAFDLASMSNEDFNAAWGDVAANTPCMVVLEDIDGVFDGRTNTIGEQGGGLTFDCLLNCISGVQQSDGVFVAFTTNDLSKVDPAIAQPASVGDVTSRPGRVDRVIELGPMEQGCRRSHARRVLGIENVEALVQRGEWMTAAQFNDLCVREALASFWKTPRLADDAA